MPDQSFGAGGQRSQGQPFCELFDLSDRVDEDTEPKQDEWLSWHLEDTEPSHVRPLPSPHDPTPAEIEEHNVSHYHTERGADTASQAGVRQTFTNVMGKTIVVVFQ